MGKSIVQRTFKFLSDMPGWTFWGVLFLLTWCFSITKIVNLDLWWHLACGKFFVENGFYPPTGTFTFSPVNPTTSNINTWFGDIVFYLIYWAGSETGLQIFRAVLVFFPLIVVASIAKRRYTSGLMFLMVLMVVGTSQIQLLRNSMFGLLFLPLIVWIWWFVKQKGDLKSYCLVFLYVPIMGVWSIMHGYAIVGAYVVLLIFAGEVVDLFIRKSPKKFQKIGLFTIAVICMYFVVNINLSLNLTRTFSSFFTENIKSSLETINNSDESQQSVLRKDKKSSEKSSSGLAQFVKKSTRFLLKGGDVGFIGEYEYPFDHTFLIFVRALVLFIIIFFTYLCFSVFFFRAHLRFSFLFPSLATILIGMGYIRTVAFPFLVACPFLIAGICEASKVFDNGKIWKSKIAEKINKDHINLLSASMLLFFFLVSNYYVIRNDYVTLTGIVSGAPGFGRADRHRTVIPKYILEKFPEEKMYNSYNTGSLLLWEWYGKKKVFIDGRSITYQRAFYNDFRYNYSFESLEKMGIRRAVLGVSDDYDWFEAYFRRNWGIICFDTGMMLFERRMEEGYEQFYGNIPKFLGKPEDVDRLQNESKIRFGRFLTTMIEYMLIFGRLDDSLKFYTSIENLVNKLSDRQKYGLHDLKRLMDDVQGEFGAKNRTVLVGLFKELLLSDETDRKDASLNKEKTDASIYIAFANAHFQIGNMKKGVNFLSSAADTAKTDISVQIQVADHFYKLRALGPAIKHYERAVSLAPGRVHEYNKLGVLYHRKGDILTAEKYFQKAIQADPKVIESYINLTAAYLVQNKMMNALAVNDKGLKVEPDNIHLLELRKQIAPE